MCGLLLYKVEGGPYKEYSVYIKQIKERHHSKTLVSGKICQRKKKVIYSSAGQDLKINILTQGIVCFYAKKIAVNAETSLSSAFPL